MSNFKTSYKATMPKILCYWQKDKCTQGIGSNSAIDLHIFGQLIFDKGVKVGRKDSQQMILKRF